MKKVISLLLTAMLLLSMLPATMAEGVEYIPAPYALDAERAGPKAYVEPVFYANGEGEPTIGVTYVGVIKTDGKYFKDSNNNHELDPFEDWRLDPETRAADLVAKMSVEQKIGLSLAQMVLMPGATTYEAALDADGNVDFSKLMVVSEKVFDVAMDDPTRVNNSTAEIIAFNNRMGVVRVMSDVGAGVLYNNATNLTTEYAAAATGEPCIPFTLISNPQKFPGEPGTMGLAAAVMGDVANGGDYSLIERFADLDRQIWDAKGLDRMYGRQIDLITDPRWGRNVTTFTEDPAVMANITTALIKGYQGGTDGLQPNGVGLIVKHFPGDSASYNGFKSHYKTGQWRMYRTENAMEKYFLPGFQAAVDCKTAGIMSCYSRPMPINANQTYRGVDINSDSVATSYNATLLQTLLRDTMGFEGFVNTDSNILFDIPWGVEELCLTAVVSGVGGAGILKQEQGDGVGNDLGGIPAADIVRVLGQNNTLGGDPIGDHVGAVADVGVGLRAPCIAVGLNSGLLHRAHGGKGSQLVKVSAGVAQGDGQGLAILAGNDIQGVEVRLGGHVAVCIGVADGILIAVDHADNGLSIGGSGVGRGQTLEGVLKVLRGQVGAIAPLQAVTHREGPDQTVIADSVALSLTGDDLVVLINEQQRLKDGDQRVGAVDCVVQRGVQRLGVGTELDSKAAGNASALFAGGSLGGGCGAGLGGGCGAGRAAAGSERSSHAAGHSHGSNVLHLHVKYPPNSLYFIPNPLGGAAPCGVNIYTLPL